LCLSNRIQSIAWLRPLPQQSREGVGRLSLRVGWDIKIARGKVKLKADRRPGAGTMTPPL
jgi:hypothetical protein